MPKAEPPSGRRHEKQEIHMATPTRPGLHHIALTVTDLEASMEWYASVFDIKYQMDGPHEGGIGKLLADDAFGLVIVLHRHDTNEGETFGETRTGLDHVGFAVPTRADLEAWQDHLEANGVVRSDTAAKPLTQSPIADEPYGSILVFRDPDNIQLEFFAPPAA
jgi:catechol 2,3-dioxygenase-like lactoylglutathione lyase family enzyme